MLFVSAWFYYAPFIAIALSFSELFLNEGNYKRELTIAGSSMDSEY